MLEQGESRGGSYHPRQPGRAMQGSGLPSPDPLESLRFTLLTFIRYSSRNPAISVLWETIGRQNPPPSVDSVRAHIEEPVDQLAASGRLGEIERAHIGQILWAMMHGVVAVQREDPDVVHHPARS